MEKFTQEEKEILETNPNIQAVLSNQVLYTKEFKEKAIVGRLGIPAQQH